MSAGYVASGAFQSDIEKAIGKKLEKRDAPEEREDWYAEQLALLPKEIAEEVDALFTLYGTYIVPPLCGLDVGSFCSLPAQHGEERAAVLRYWFGGNEASTDAVMGGLELYNGNGGTYVIIGKEGVGALYEDPYEYAAYGTSLEPFLKMLIAADTIALTDGIDAARRAFEPLVGDARHARFLVHNRVLNRKAT